MAYLILVRHGESRWNIANKFTGWVDVPLSEVGINEALISAKRLEGVQLDYAFTSKLERAQETLLIILSKQDATGIFVHTTGKRKSWSKHKGKLGSHEIPILSSDAINERYYGRLQGMDKDEARKRYGKEQVFKWRRSYDTRPPGGESLKDVYERAVLYYRKKIFPLVKKGNNVIVSAHGNSLRAIIKYLDNISDEDIPHLELSYGTPIVYEWKKGKLVKESHVHSFNRPVHWQKPRYYKTKKSSGRKKKK
jgi:2,3-bisphosphoglycerate-dependent phosphoglycerate mutase